MSSAVAAPAGAAPRAAPGAVPPGAVRGRAAWALLAAWAVLLAIAVTRHEPWFDEAQAWLLARDAGVVDLFARLLRYEGTPGLWHALLLVPAKLGLPYASMAVLAAAAALAGAALLALRSPFPLWLRAGLLLSFPLGYQYAAVARSYVLLPPLLFALAALHERRHDRIGLHALLLGLVASTSVHGLLIAGTLGAVDAVGSARAWPSLSAGGRRRHLLAGAGLATVGAVTVALLWPPDDTLPGTGTRPGLAGVADVGVFLDLALTGVPWLTAVAVAGAVVLLVRARVLARWALPTLALLLFSAVRYHAPHHDALPFLVLVYGLWIALARPAAADHAGAGRAWRALALAALVPLVALQVVGWGRAWRADVTGPYSGGPGIAAYLDGLDDDVVVHGYDPRIVAALPYLDRNPYANLRGGRLPGYWSHTPGGLPHGMDLEEVARARPDVVVWGVAGEDTPDLPGYRPVRRFDGVQMGRDGPVRRDDVVVYERTGVLGGSS